MTNAQADQIEALAYLFADAIDQVDMFHERGDAHHAAFWQERADGYRAELEALGATITPTNVILWQDGNQR